MTDADTEFRTLAPGEGPSVGPTEAKDLKEELLRVQRQLAVATERSDELIERAIRAESAKKEFMARISYEIRTPLNAIVGCSQILAEETITEEQRNQSHLIESSAQQLLDLIVDGMAKLLAVQGEDADAIGGPTKSSPSDLLGCLAKAESRGNTLRDTQDLSDKAGLVNRRHSFCGCVLVVDDNQIDRMIAQKLLEMSGLEVAVVKDGAEAVDTIQSNRYDMVFMDMEMPGKNGYEATRELRSMGVQTPVVALTAHALKTDRAKCLAAGCNDYLPKPIDRAELLRILQGYLVQEGVVSNEGTRTTTAR